jgi:hypothetical protein
MKLHVIILLLVSLASLVFAEQSELLKLDSAFVNGEYEKVELLALRILHSADTLRSNDRARVNLTTGYALIMLDRESDAREYFKQALDAAPELNLDPIQVSPKFKVIFDEVKASYKRNVTPMISKGSGSLASQSISRPTHKALLLNLIAPGTGQINEGHTLRGAFYLGAQVLSAAWLIKSLSDVHDSREAYLHATDSTTISAKYDVYNSDHRIAWFAGIATGIVYLATQADLILYRPQGEQAVKLTFLSGNIVGLSVNW